jgi:hypothetical protein
MASNSGADSAMVDDERRIALQRHAGRFHALGAEAAHSGIQSGFAASQLHAS